MILYQGELIQNENQEETLKSLYNDCLMTLSSEKRLHSIDVVNACDTLTKKIMNGLYDNEIKPLLEELDIPFDYFLDYISLFNKPSLLKKIAIELGDDYLELSSLDNENKREIYPLGILFHIAAGNIDVLPAYSVIEGLLVGNINILKLPTGDKGVSVLLLSELIKIEPKLKEYIYVFDVPSTELKTLQIFADISDAIVVWGGDSAVKAARKMASINTKIIEWGHKLSFAYANKEASDEDLKDLSHHICNTNQLLCSSCQGIYVDTNSREELDEFANRFFNIFLEENTLYKPIPFGMLSKNAVSLYYEKLVMNNTKKRIWKKDGISVITSNDSVLELSYLFRNIWIKMLPSENIVSTIKPHKNYLQTCSILSNKLEYDDYKRKLIQAGLVRIKKPDEMSEVILGESHDGMYPLRLYSRVVETYVKQQNVQS